MKAVTTLIAAAFVAGSVTLAFAQAGGSGAGAGGAAGSDLSTPQKSLKSPAPGAPPVNRRGDDMAPMQGANVSNQMNFKSKSKKQKMDARMYR